MSDTIKVFSYEIEHGDGALTLRQESFGVEDSVIYLSLEQLPLLIRQLRELCPPSGNAERQQRWRDRQKAAGATE